MRKIKTFNLFESVDIDDILSTVKEILMELDFSDIQQRAVIRRMSGQEYIRIIVWKPISGVFRGFVSLSDVEMVFRWSDISDVMDSVSSYLESEDFYFYSDSDEVKNKGSWDGMQYTNMRTNYQVIFKKRNEEVKNI